MRLGVLASHGGTNLQAIIDACKEGRLDAKVCVVISNNSNSMALERAKREGISHRHLSSKTHPDDTELDQAILLTLEDHEVDVVVMAGYMKMLGPATLRRFRNRVMNSHPALLPKFGGRGMYGCRVHEAVLAKGERVTGVTIHLADDQYDHGPTVAQCEVSVLDGDTLDSLTQRVQESERALWVDTLRKIATSEIDLDEIAAEAVGSRLST